MRRFRYRKVTPEMKNEILLLHKQGLTQQKIAERFNLAPSTVQYHLSPRTRELAILRAKRSGERPRDKESTRKWHREYMRERYRNDPEFKERVKGHVREYSRKARERTRERAEKDPQFREELEKHYREKRKTQGGGMEVVA